MITEDLWPLFMTVALLNLACAVFIMLIAYKYWKLNINEFYHKFIVLFLTIGYLARTTELAYMYGYFSEDEFNQRDDTRPKIFNFLAYTPIIMHGLSGLTYFFRWTSY